MLYPDSWFSFLTIDSKIDHISIFKNNCINSFQMRIIRTNLLTVARQAITYHITFQENVLSPLVIFTIDHKIRYQHCSLTPLNVIIPSYAIRYVYIALTMYSTKPT